MVLGGGILLACLLNRGLSEGGINQLATDDWLYPGLLGFEVKIHGSEKVMRIRHCDGRHFQLGYTLDQGIGLICTLEQTVLSMNVQVHEGFVLHGFHSCNQEFKQRLEV